MTTLNTIIEFSSKSNPAVTGDFGILLILGLMFIFVLSFLVFKKRYKLFTTFFVAFLAMCCFVGPAIAETQVDASNTVQAFVSKSDGSITIDDGYLRKITDSNAILKNISIKSPNIDCEWIVEVSNGATFKGKNGQSATFDLDLNNEKVKYSVSNINYESAMSLINTKDVVVSYTIDISDPIAEEKAIVDKVDARAEAMNKIFLQKTVSIQDYGAKPDDKDQTANNTGLIYKAICDVSKSGGGTVVVPSGKLYYTSAIHLEDNVNLKIEDGATLKFIDDPKFYQGKLMKDIYGDAVDDEGLTLTRFESVELMNYSPFIYAYGKKNIALTGKGTLDGSASKDVWDIWVKDISIQGENGQAQDAPRAKLFKQGQENVPVANRKYGEASGAIDSGADDGFLRTNFIQPYKCNGVIISGVNIKASPMWDIDTVLCDEVLIENVSINSHLHNNDGCDPECSSNVVIRNNSFDVGDDCIAIKSGRNGDGLRVNVPTTNVVIYNNQFIGERAGIAIGSEITGGVHNVYSHNNIMDSDKFHSAYNFKTNYIRGGKIKNIYYRDDIVKSVQKDMPVINVSLNYDIKNEAKMMKSLGVTYHAQLPEFSNVRINNFTVNKDHVSDCGGKYFLKLDGFAKADIDENCIIDPGYPDFCNVENFIISNSNFYGAAQAFSMAYVNGLRINNCSINGTYTDDRITNSQNLCFENCDFTNSCVKEEYLTSVPYSKVINCKF